MCFKNVNLFGFWLDHFGSESLVEAQDPAAVVVMPTFNLGSSGTVL